MTAKSDRIEKLLEDPDLKEAFSSVREHYRDAIELTPLDDNTVLEIRKMLHLLSEVEQDLYRAIQDGQLEDFNAAEEERHSLIRKNIDGLQH